MVCDILLEESNILPVSTPVTICGDIHGQLFRTGGYCADHDKVKANAVRSLINLLQILQQQQASENTESMQLAMSKLLDCVRSAGSAKVKWNACHAIGNLVKHRAFFATNHLAGILFPALSQLVVQHANFKVRINATRVLLQVEMRQDFGSHFPLVWRSLLDALERSNALDNFEEYNHRDALQQQLCLAMAHLLMLTKASDLPNLNLNCNRALAEKYR
ncbi:hypothetical protein KR200_009590 [Drosophila serrata]|nr:hypothetical protein KR200_009590 [Drosophila serrata]